MKKIDEDNKITQMLIEFYNDALDIKKLSDFDKHLIKYTEALEQYITKARIKELDEILKLHCKEGDEKILLDTIRANARLRKAELRKGLK